MFHILRQDIFAVLGVLGYLAIRAASGPHFCGGPPPLLGYPATLLP